MLRLKNITKTYVAGGNEVYALKGISMAFRKCEFVSILGPSGCGKTTTLNIIGGLDKYTSGDLFISGKSTKNFKDRDWDVYRNHRVGFIFQAYNLIPHQTVLGNVELALTISGVSKKEREIKSKAALDKVGLKGQYYKKPNQLSGGQCQRVAIARALVNDPEILLADEPTGALDTKTSVQIMELIKEIAKERLVIMVTHNPELAEKYSTRIIRLLDGTLQSDSNPFSEEDEIAECKKIEDAKALQTYDEQVKSNTKEKAKMSLWTAFKLSARNLLSKHKRTIMVAFAGSIGIVGVSTVLAVSTGVHNYINNMENDMLSGNPVSITSSTLDYSSIMSSTESGNTSTSVVNPDNKTDNGAYINSNIETLVNMNGITSTNTITDEYMDYLSKIPDNAIELIKYNYGYKIAPNIFTDFTPSDGKVHNMSVSAIQSTYASVLKNVKDFSQFSSMINSVTVMTEMPSSAEYIAKQYDVVKIADNLSLEDVLKDKTALVAVVSQSHNTLNDLELAEYGFFNQEQFLNYVYKINNASEYNDSPLLAMPETISYDTLFEKKFTWYPNDTVYSGGDTENDYGPQYYCSAYSDGTLENDTSVNSTNYRRAAFTKDDDCVDLNVKCVLKLKSNLSYGCLTSGGFYYTNALTKHAMEVNKDSEIVSDAKDNDDTLYNVEMGYKFRFDGNSKETIEHTNLSASSGSNIMSYISQLFGMSSSSKSVDSYSLAALGGSELPSSVNFYVDTFEQKDLLTAYLDKWNNNTLGNLYKKNEYGFYVGTKKEDNGTESNIYFYKDTNSGKYFQVDMDDEGLLTDNKKDQYKLVVDENDNQNFYKRIDDTYGDDFYIDEPIEIISGISINPYTLVSNTILNDPYTNTTDKTLRHLFTDVIEDPTAEDDSGIFYYENEGNTYYVMKTQNQNYYEVQLDKDGNLVAVNDGYTRYANDASLTHGKNDESGNPQGQYYTKVTTGEGEDKVVTYEPSDPTMEAFDDSKAYYVDGDYYYPYTETKIESFYPYVLNNEGEFVVDKTKRVDDGRTKNDKGEYVKDDEFDDNRSDLYKDTSGVNYANVSKNPVFTIDEDTGSDNSQISMLLRTYPELKGTYQLDTKGYYIDLTAINDLTTLTSEPDLVYKNDNRNEGLIGIKTSGFYFDIAHKEIQITDYSKFDFYYLDTLDDEYSYNYVDVEKYTDSKGKVSYYLLADDVSSYLSSYNLDQYGLDEYISDKYLINEDGSLSAVNKAYEDDPITISQLLSKNLLGNELTDLSVLQIDESLKITYTDSIGLIVTMVDTLINVITYALVAFTALSLVVSTVMIGIITYVSVVERTKEIGVIRSLGGRKRDVSHLFNAETLIIGLSSGIIGIGLTYLISLIINLIVGNLTGIYTIATLPVSYAFIMIGISVLLTMISGLIPASSAAKKDPVVALRSE